MALDDWGDIEISSTSNKGVAPLVDWGDEEVSQPVTISNVKKWAVQSLLNQEVDYQEGLDFSTRFDLSFADTDEEKSAKFAKKYPQGAFTRINVPEVQTSFLMYKKNANDPEEQWHSVEDEGVTYKDIADVGGGLPEFAGSTAALFLPGMREAGILKTMLVTGLGALGGHLTKEGIEEYRGDQKQPWADVLYDASEKGAITAMFSGGATAAAKVTSGVKGGGMLDTPGQVQHILKKIEKAPELAKHTPISVAQPERKIISRMTAQAVSTSKHGQRFIAEAEHAAVKELPGLIGPAEYIKIGKGLRQEIAKVYGKGKAIALSKTRRTPLEKTGKAAIQGLKDDFVQNSSKLNTQLYNKVDEVAAKSQPVFDLTSAIEEAKTLRKGIIGDVPPTVKKAYKPRVEGRTMVPEVTPGAPVDVSDAPKQELLKVVQDIIKLDPVQTDYKVVKELRTRLFSLIDNQPWQWDSNKYQAQQMWNKLTSAMKNPMNNAKDFVKALNTANTHNKLRANILSDDYIQEIIKTAKPINIAKALSAEGGMTENVEFALKNYAPKKLKTVQDGIKYHWLTDKPGKAVETFENMKQLYRKEGMRRIMTNSEEHHMRAIAKELDKINSSRIATVFEKQTTAGKVVKELIRDQDPEGIAELVTTLGGKNSAGTRLLKVGILEDLLNEATEQTTRDTLKINSKVFAAKWKEYNRNGVLDEIFDEKSRDSLGAIEIFSKMWEKHSDPGVSLEAAQLISLLKHPATFVKGTHGLAANEALAWVLLSPKTRKYLAGSGAKPIRGTSMKLFSMALGNMSSNMDASNRITTFDEKEEK